MTEMRDALRDHVAPAPYSPAAMAAYAAACRASAKLGPGAARAAAADASREGGWLSTVGPTCALAEAAAIEAAQKHMAAAADFAQRLCRAPPPFAEEARVTGLVTGVVRAARTAAAAEAAKRQRTSRWGAPGPPARPGMGGRGYTAAVGGGRGHAGGGHAAPGGYLGDGSLARGYTEARRFQ